MLRIQRPRGLGREAEKFGVELVEPIEERCAPHIGRIR